MNKIVVDASLPNHPGMLQLARVLDLDAVQVVGLRINLWCWAAQNREDGSLAGLSATDIERAAGWSGERGKFFTAIKRRDVALLVNNRLADWDRLQGPILQHRARMERLRRARGDPPQVDCASTGASTSASTVRGVPSRPGPDRNQGGGGAGEGGSAASPPPAKPAPEAALPSADELWSAMTESMREKVRKFRREAGLSLAHYMIPEKELVHA